MSLVSGQVCVGMLKDASGLALEGSCDFQGFLCFQANCKSLKGVLNLKGELYAKMSRIELKQNMN